jgi:EpsI family protein
MAETPWRGRPLGRRQFVIGGASLLTAGAGFAIVPRHGTKPVPPSALEAAIPTRVGAWGPAHPDAFVLPLEDEEIQGVYGNILTRGYQHPDGTGVMLMIAYAGNQTGTIVVHRPEACYPANGFELSNRAQLELVDKASKLAVPTICYTASSYDRTEQLLYWTRVGTYFPVDWVSEKVALVRSNFSGWLPDGVLVRASIISDDVAGSRVALLDFVRTLSENVTALGRSILFTGTGIEQSS